MTSSKNKVYAKMPPVKVKPLYHHTEALARELAYQSAGAAGADICSADFVIIQPNGRMAVSTGIALQIPAGYEGQIRSRSGLAAKHGIHVLNSPGTIDSDYRGEIMVILHNTENTPFRIMPGDRIAQIVFQKVERATFEIVGELDDTARGDGGLGSTGV